MRKYIIPLAMLLSASSAYGACVEREPSVSLAPTTQRAATPGCEIEVRVDVTNLDDEECASRTWVVAVGVAEGDGVPSLAHPFVTLEPGASAEVEAGIISTTPTYGYLIGSATKPRTRGSREVTTYAPTIAEYAFVSGCGCEGEYE